MPFLIGSVIAAYCAIHLIKTKKPVPAKILFRVMTSLVILAVLIFTVTGSLILHASRGNQEADCPYIVVLGAQVRPDGPSDTLRERINAAYQYLTAHPETTAIVSGGKGDDEHISEALSMAQELVKLGISPDRIRMEDQSTSTFENLTYSLDIIEESTGSRPTSIGVVSSEFHLFRVGMQAKAYGLTITGIPAKTGSFDRYLHYFIREIAGVWHYILLGGEQS
jgi:uncharacterized SAM-binding protein YcdF (DUF218 family)